MKYDREIAKKQSEIASLRKAQAEQFGRTYWTCKHCGRRRQYRKMEYVKYYGYVEPYGCTGGDYHSLQSIDLTCFWCNRMTSMPPDWQSSFKDAFARVRYKTRDGFQDRPPFW